MKSPPTPPNVGQHVKLDVSITNVRMPNQIVFQINLDKNKEQNNIRLNLSRLDPKIEHVKTIACP